MFPHQNPWLESLDLLRLFTKYRIKPVLKTKQQNCSAVHCSLTERTRLTFVILMSVTLLTGCVLIPKVV